jgi:uncharacterized protein YndB with AHSA1/START domain
VRARLAAPVDAVWHALTDARALRAWLAEFTEVELPHRYTFWGRFTPEGDEPRQRLLHADDRSLRLSWRLDGQDTTVDIAVADGDPGETVLTVSQSHVDPADIAAGAPRAILLTFWFAAVHNLADHLVGRPITPRCDMTASRLCARVPIGAPTDAVFASLVDGASFSRWFGYPITIEPRVGGRWAMGTAATGYGPVGTVLVLEQDRRLVMAEEGSGPAHWELEPDGHGTLLTFRQGGTQSSRPPHPGWCGWLSGIAELRRFHEVPDWRPIWLPV